MQHAEIIGHKRQLAELQTDIDSGNISHAYLFAGPAHLGKTTVAKWFAEQLITKDLDVTKRDDALRRMHNLTHPDFLSLDQLWIEEASEDYEIIAKSTNVPQQHRAKTPTMKTDTIGIDDVREIQNRVQETGEGHWRVCLITRIDRLQEAAANAFLKTLEEPPPGRVFILTTEALDTLPTILSRTRVVHFDRVSPADLGPLLKNESPDDAHFLSHLSQGAPGMLLRLLHDPDLRRAEKTLHAQAVSFWSARTPLERLKIVEPLLERGTAADRLLLHLSLALREYPLRTHRHERELMELIRGLETNASRPLLVQRFLLGLEAMKTA